MSLNVYYVRKVDRNKINGLSIHLKLEKEGQARSKLGRINSRNQWRSRKQ